MANFGVEVFDGFELLPDGSESVVQIEAKWEIVNAGGERKPDMRRRWIHHVDGIGLQKKAGEPGVYWDLATKERRFRFKNPYIKEGELSS